MTAPADADRVVASDGTTLRYRAWTVPSPAAALLLIHGLGEHSGRYEAVARELNAHGISVFAPDLRGHGRSEGRRGHARSFELLLSDLERVLETVRELQGGAPLFMFGQSLGGLVALRYAQTRPGAPLRGLILSAPLLRLASPPPRWLHLLARMMNRALPGVGLYNRIDPADLSHDPAAVERYRSDPLVHDRVTPRLYAGMCEAMTAARAEVPRLNVPAVLILVPGADPVVDPDATLEVAAEMANAVPRVDVRGYTGFFHEPFHEVDRARPTADLVRWIAARTA